MLLSKLVLVLLSTVHNEMARIISINSALKSRNSTKIYRLYETKLYRSGDYTSASGNGQ